MVGQPESYAPAFQLRHALPEGDQRPARLGEPRIVDFVGGTKAITEWQRQKGAASTLVLLDQPTIVKNAAGRIHHRLMSTTP